MVLTDKQYRQEREQMQSYDERIAVSHYMQALNTEKQRQTELKQKREIIDNAAVLNAVKHSISYRQYILIRDLCFSNWAQIATDKRRERITDTDIQTAITIANSVYPLFNSNTINEYIAAN